MLTKIIKRKTQEYLQQIETLREDYRLDDLDREYGIGKLEARIDELEEIEAEYNCKKNEL